jgi:release factor glutamine methyltransferase
MEPQMEPISGQASAIETGCTIASILAKSALGALETRILVGHALNLSRVQLITQAGRSLAPREAAHVSALIERRIKGEPIAYITGLREFYGLPFEVTPDVLIPRPETELLVELAAEHLPENGNALDMGTGSGAIAVALAQLRPDAAVTAIDNSKPALEVAYRNAVRHAVSINFMRSDWYGALSGKKFHLIAANPPYIVKNDPHLSQGDLRFEPVDALTDQADGLSALRTIVAGAAGHLKPGGWIFVEHGYDQAPEVRALLSHQFCQVQSWCDLAGIERVSGGQRQP